MTVQDTLDTLVGTSADLGYFYSSENKRIYSCSTRLLNGALAYGTGPTLEEAIDACKRNPPIRAEKVA